MAMTSLMNFMRPAPYQPEITDKTTVDRAYKYWRIRIFYSIYVGYVFFYFTRKSFTFVMPEMVQDLNLTYAKLGILSTVLYITYGISKFTSGILSDRSNPRYFMAIGLILTGILNVFFGLSSSIWMFALLCALNGVFQGWGWPPIAKQLTYWFSKKERGTWWSVCSTSHSVGGGLIPILVAYALIFNFTDFSGWRYAMMLPGVMCVAVGLFLLNRLRDVPQSLGLPPIELYRGEKDESRQYIKESETPLTAKQILFERVLNNKFVWVMAVSYFFVYVVRTAINDWSIPYLVGLGYDRVLASASVMWFEIGAFIGTLVAGWCSDLFFQGRRIPFMLLCAVGMAITLYCFADLPPAAAGTSIKYCYSLMASIGFFVFGPQMLIGLAAAEYVDKRAACTANGFVGCWAYVGAAITGYPLGLVIDYSWDYYYWILVTCSIITFIILLPLTFKAEQEPTAHPSWSEA